MGEEVDGSGAIHANDALPAGWAPRYTIVGEPTDNRFAKGGKGLFKAVLSARGVAGHSSQDVGPSAVHELVGALSRLLVAGWGSHPRFGEGTLNVGCVHGGVAGNVVADRAEADLVLRTVEPAEVVAERLRACLGEHTELSFSKGYGPCEFEVPAGAGSEPIVVAFGTDAPFLGRWGRPLLYGPGSITDAHTDHEKLTRRSFEQSVADYESTARELLARA